MPIRAHLAGVPHAHGAPEGLFHEDGAALTRVQRACAGGLSVGIQLQQEAYLTGHPEVKAMLEIFVCKVAKLKPRTGFMKLAAEHFTRPAEELDREIRQHLKLPPTGPYFLGKKQFSYTQEQLLRLVQDRKAAAEVAPAPAEELYRSAPPSTLSSPFSSICTSATTLPTPEPIPTPEPTLSEDLLGLVSRTVDKAVYAHVDDQALMYDTAYVELSHAVEEAMEVPVVELRQDLAEMLHDAYKMCELEILDKERIARELEIANRKSKKCKKSLRDIANFRGHALRSPAPSEPEPPSEPCAGGVAPREPPPSYNRYAKDRFGVWRSAAGALPAGNTTVTPVITPDNSENSDETAGD